MRKTSALLLVLVFLMTLFAVQVKPVSATNDVSEDSWVSLEPIPTTRRNFGVAVANGKIYAIGGSYNEALSTNEEYNPVTNTWTTKASMPTPRSDFGIAVIQNKIYCIGGIIDYDWSGYGKGILSTVNEVYDPETDTWENKTSMPTERQRPLANAVNGKIFLIGGFQYRDLPPPRTTIQLGINEVYDPETDSWTTKTPLPNTSYGPASTTVDNKIYVISGFHSNLTQIYDSESDTWSQGAAIPTAVALAGAGATTGEMAPKRIYVIGGYPSYDEEPLNQVYGPQTDTWTTGRRMLTARHSLGIAVMDDTLYAIGGSSSNLNVGYYDENERYIPIGHIPESPDTDKPTLPPIEPFPTIPIAASVVAVAVVCAGLFVYFKKR